MVRFVVMGAVPAGDLPRAAAVGSAVAADRAIHMEKGMGHIVEVAEDTSQMQVLGHHMMALH